MAGVMVTVLLFFIMVIIITPILQMNKNGSQNI